jgi:hypothetical protein
MDVSYELGRLKGKKTIVLKEQTTFLPKSLAPVYTAFDLEDPSGCLNRLEKELESIYGEAWSSFKKKPFLPKQTTFTKQPAAALDEKQSVGVKPLHETADETLLLAASIFHVTEVYAQMFSQGMIHPSILQGLHDQIRNVLRSKESFRNQIERSKIGPEVKVLLGMEEKRNTLICSVWPAGAYSGFAIVNKASIGAILTRSTPDLIFAINMPGTIFSPAGSQISHEVNENPDTIAIYIPPGFTVPEYSEQVVLDPLSLNLIQHSEPVVLTISNARIRVLKPSPSDLYGPEWTVVYVSADTITSSAVSRTSQNQFINFMSGCHYVKIKSVTAPPIAGRYFLKIALLNSKASPRIRGECISDSAGNGKQSPRFIPTENWPVLLVKGEINPAIITGTIRHYNIGTRLHGQPIRKPGRVFARMTMRIDPYTGQTRPDLPLVDTAGYFDATAQGRYEVQGVAPGVYNLYASAAGFPQTLIQHAIKVQMGQLLRFDGYPQPGVVIHGNVFLKDQLGDAPWAENSYVKIELYDGPTLNLIPDPRARLVSWAGTTDKNHITRWPQDVGPPQDWSVQSSTTHPFQFEFGVKGEYGAPRDLDGMVPQVYATWVNGLTPGRYYTRAWVFRYVQSALDGSAFQEYYFDVTPNEWAGDVTLPIDLRLSSWVNKTVHFHNQNNSLVEDPINTGAGFMSGYLTGADGNIYSYNQTALGAGSDLYPYAPGIGFWPHGSQFSGNTGTPVPLYNGVSYFGSNVGPQTFVNLDQAGVNARALLTGRANIQFWGINDTWGGENYGIPSGTYTPSTFVLGYLPENPPEQVSVTLSGTPTSISDHMVRGVGFKLTLFSIDWERPTVNRAWEFGNTRPVDIPFGLNIDVGFYANHTLVEGASDENYWNRSWASTVVSMGLFQNAIGFGLAGDTASSTELQGGGIALTDSRGSVQSALGAFFGNELKRTGFIGGYTAGSDPWIFPFLAAKSFWPRFNLPYVLEPTAFDSGMYDLRGFTYGYVQDQTFSVYAARTQIADVRINLVIGVNITLDVLFKKERVITGTPANMSARIRLFNDQSQLVGEWMSSEGTYVTGNGNARAADGTNSYPFGSGRNGATNMVFPQSGASDFNFLPGGTKLLHAVIFGLPQASAQFNDAGYTLSSGVYRLFFPTFLSGTYVGDPVFTPTCRFAVNCYSGGEGQYPFPNTGILGAPDYQGGWTAEVDFVNWYGNNTSSACAGSSSPYGVNFCYGIGGSYYPPVPGLLMGESYHIIPGTLAKSGISLTEDAALSNPPTFLGHSMALNHLGPYSQQGVWQVSGAHNSGEASGIFEVDLNGLVPGNVLAFTWSNEFRPLSWGLVSVTGAGLPSTGLNFYTYDGIYQAYLPSTIGASGSVIYSFSLNAPGYAPQTWKGAVSSGQTGTGQNLYLEQTNIPVPEFSTITIAAFMALATSVFVLRHKRH